MHTQAFGWTEHRVLHLSLHSATAMLIITAVLKYLDSFNPLKESLVTKPRPKDLFSE